MDRRQIDQYLALGFVADLPPGEDPLALLSAWSRAPRRDESSVSESGLVREGVRALKAAFAECAAQVDGGRDQVVMLSGGLDSRTILGALLDEYSPREVRAATFGLPGERDFDLAAQVARAAGVQHETVESFSVDWTTEGLVDSVLARRLPLPFPYGQRYLSYHLHRRIGRESVFWDGLCGDVLGGKRQTAKDDAEWTWDEAVEHFFARNLLRDWQQYAGEGFEPRSVLPAAPLCDAGLLSYPDQLNYAVRQARYVATRRMRDHTVQTPFLSGPWLDFMLAVPGRYRRESLLYREVQEQAFPRLFALPTTREAGRRAPRSRVARGALAARRRAERGAERLRLRRPAAPPAVIGANDAIRDAHRQRPQNRELVVRNLTDLANRRVVPALEADTVVAQALDGTLGHTRLSVLLGLELNLKAAERVTSVDAGPGRPPTPAG